MGFFNQLIPMKTYLFFFALALCFQACIFNSGKSYEELVQEWEQKKKEFPDAIEKPYLKSGIYFVDIDSTSTSVLKKSYKTPTLSFLVNPNPIVTSSELNNVEVYNSQNNSYNINLSYKGNGPSAICEATVKAFAEKGRMAFVVDNVLISAPVVGGGPICGGVVSVSEIKDIETAMTIRDILLNEIKK